MLVKEEASLLIERLTAKRKFIQVVTGPRQVGKTTMLLQVLKKIKAPYVYESADALTNESSAIWLKQQWERARLILQTSNKKEVVLVIDEVQKIANWSEYVKACWDEDTRFKNNIKVVLSGSSRLMLMYGLTESLAGRFEIIPMSHWSYTEMKKAFGFTPQQYVWFGAYPGSAEWIHDEFRWKEYVRNSIIEPSISKDILMLTRIDKPALMKRLFELGSLYTTQIVSLTKIIGQLVDAGNTTTLSHYIHLLDQAGLLGEVSKYSGSKIMQRASSPKFQVYTNALTSSLMPETFESIQNIPEKWGRMVESAVGAHLLGNKMKEGFDLYYWRHVNDEVDFVMVKNNKVIGLEVKTNSWVHTKGMTAFEKKNETS